ncbi:16S rRNA (cytosine(967)-C(5))-methyltransferase RsmB [Listeria booriae]|uniref:16S rRNA (cytosine(967)-C(5))-methyltransferase RsmB n=1 Tax=Listeria booriae TaxID=1552123 RepID=UPI00162A1F0B|nr:16S rRNA (cytosine(967)-C(5))-methyltransferase RsmB [Listeria booriae]MBC1272615.1 16S rRNA (cytosine(967)-C(5))-methyltransferase RsmB [Listeria booriae]MBC1286637.1 16S rRNA (cytosine(967)-C(5))-methyltransferase RsmB [Listeria booriae]
MKKPETVREIALDLIEKIENNQSFSHLLINDALKKSDLNPMDRALLTELVYGTTQRRITLDFYLAPFLKKTPENWVLNLLRLSVYQLTFLDKVPEHAILHEAGEIARDRGHEGVTKFVNGVLRNVIRKGVPKIEDITDETTRIAVETSLPTWLAKRWIAQFGAEKTREIGLSFMEAPSQSVRVNENKVTVAELQAELSAQGIETEQNPYIPEALMMEKGSISETQAYHNGRCTIQDESSMLVAYALQLEDGLRVLDACSAPGGKTTHIGEKMHNTGEIIALDIHPHKTKLVNKAAKRLDLTNITTEVLDARKATEQFEAASFDRVLVDAPCSGFGVLRRKPDIKYSKTEADVVNLARIQEAILAEVSTLLKENGILVYSTCTIDQQENRGVVEAFLQTHPEFQLEHVQLPEKMQAYVKADYLELVPTDIGSDGFFIASFRKKTN